ncbi:protein phosphatase 2C domain-containing protein [Pseudomonas entomophila]|uniref:PP2C family protein-serine/threonine phosphatase n=1 Tax=Pseudomonas entomophila TaxID=312306 RepID=UPI0023D7D3C9|nr:protein phosphatase 2C domain-containing protein [Pseudomonas entomophila]MDF0732401.1 protein phosphatase 2C domain-containing protein [Pseudomonas entomophila]
MSAPENHKATAPSALRGGIAFGHSDTGPVRRHNEDHFLIDSRLELLAVADGMGGHEAGALASALALEALRDCLAGQMAQVAHASSDPDATCQVPSMQALGVLHEALEAANARLYAHNHARQLSEGRGMGTTLTGLWRPQAGGPLLAFHVGDSRLYRYRGGELEQLSRDQTWYQQALDAGHFDRLPARNVLLQAIGPAPRVEPQVWVQGVQAGDLLMLCSDGVHGCVPHHELARVLGGAGRDGLEVSSQRLIRLAAEYGGRDNATVVLVKYE